VYLTASWWAPCRVSVPQLVVTYNEQIKKNESIELIMLSVDKDPSDALSWAKKENFPWPTILESEISKHSEKWNFYQEIESIVPFYMLIDGDGNVLATDKKTAFEKADLK